MFGLQKLQRRCRAFRLAYLSPRKEIPQAMRPACFIFGNGPSLKKDISDKIDYLKSQDVFVVNFFGTSKLLSEIKPNNYVLADPAFWGEIKNGDVELRVEELFKTLVEVVDWPLTIFVSYVGAKTVSKALSGNSNIKIIPFVSDSFDSQNTSLKYRIYQKNLAMPYLQTVLNAAIFLAINSSYKEINILGMENDWFKNLVLLDNNVLGMVNEHFYKEQSSIVKLVDPYTGKSSYVHEELRNNANALETHHHLNDYALFRGVLIYNLASNTFVDAYKRKKFTL